MRDVYFLLPSGEFDPMLIIILYSVLPLCIIALLEGKPSCLQFMKMSHSSRLSTQSK